MEINTEEKAILELNKFCDKATESIKMSAILNRALVDKKSTELVNKKVSAEYNSIQAGIYAINSKFNENSKKYAEIKQEILNILTEYEAVLIEYSEYYDLKIEQLITQKAELEAHLVGKIFEEEELKAEKIFKEKQKGKLKNSLTSGFKKIFEKFKGEKEKKKIDVQMISKMQDNIDIGLEEDDVLNTKLVKINEDGVNNSAEIEKIENKIEEIDKEIDLLTTKKINAIKNAMESKEKWMVVSNLKKPKVFTKVKRFIACKINPTKIIMKNVIDPLKNRIEEFKSDELKNIKG